MMGLGIGVVALICIGALLILAVPVILIVLFFKLIYRLLSSHESGPSAEETRTLQEINGKLNRLENRIESLESIVVATDNSK